MVNNGDAMGFWSIVCLVIGNLIGPTIFLLPTQMANYGAISIFGWIIAGVGAIFLALVFGKLSARIPKTGGPYVYARAAFGNTIGFYTAWSYWVLTWVSNTNVVVTALSCMKALVNLSPLASFVLEVGALILMLGINILGIHMVAMFENLITVIKIIPLIIIPIITLIFAGIGTIHLDNLQPFNPTGQPLITIIGAIIMLAMWGFIGLETGTVPTEEVSNAKTTIPRAIVVGTCLTTLMYMLGTITVLSALPRDQLMVASSPYTDLLHKLFGGNWGLFIAIMVGICALGTLHGWTMVVGRIALGAAHDGLFPKVFAKTGSSGAPVWGLVISTLLSIPLIGFTLKDGLIAQFNFIIDFSVCLILLVYLICVLAYFKLYLFNKSTSELASSKWLDWLIGIGALSFCLLVLALADKEKVLLSLLITVSGIPMYCWMRRGNKACCDCCNQTDSSKSQKL